MIWMKYCDREDSLLVRPLDGNNEGKGLTIIVESPKGATSITLDENDALEMIGYLWGKLNAEASGPGDKAGFAEADCCREGSE